MTRKHDSYHHLALVILVAFVLVLGCAAGAIGIVVIPGMVEHYQNATK